MRMRYSPLFSIECRHDYFSGGVCKPFSIRPTGDCLRLLERYQGLFRPTPGGGTVAFATQDEVDFLALYAESAPFSFDLISADPLLFNYTDAEMAPGTRVLAEQVYYFNNLGDSLNEEGGRHLLHPSGQALAAEPLPVRARRFKHRLEQPAGATGLSVVDTLAGDPVWRSAPLTPAAHVVPIDLGSLPDGRYRLRVDERDAMAFYLSDVSAAGRWGVVDIFPGGPAMAGRVPDNQRVLDDAGHPLAKTFAIHLNNRSTLWRYYIVNPNPEDHSYDGHRVEGIAKRVPKQADQQGTPISFAERGPTRVDGRLARVFESTQPITLHEKPGDEHEFAFKANGQGERGGRPFRLPYATGESTRLEEVAGARRMVSEIYVYL